MTNFSYYEKYKKKTTLQQKKKKGFQLHIATTDSTFIICLVLVSKYSALLEPTINVSQAKMLDLLSYTGYSKKIFNIGKNHCMHVDVAIKNLLKYS